MKRISFFVALPLLVTGWSAIPATAAASVLRCTLPNGTVSYQDKSCPNGTRGDPVDATPNQGFRFATKEQIDKAMRAPPDDPPRPRARSSSKPKVKKGLHAGERRFMRTGMHTAEVRRKIGAPDEIARPTSASGKRPNRYASQQWIYLPAEEDPQTTTVLTVRGGLVLHVDRKVTR